MELRVVWTLAQRELREALRNRWLWFFAGGFAVLALALSRASLASAGYSGLGGFGRTTASLVNALLLFVPLLGLTVGAGIIAGDRERGTLTYLMAQPLTRAEIFAGKALGASIALAASLALGFGLAVGTPRPSFRWPASPSCWRSPSWASAWPSAPFPAGRVPPPAPRWSPGWVWSS